MLYLEGTKVTDAGLVHLEGLNQLEAVNLNNTKVTDVGIEHLHGLTKLRFLWISGTQVTNAGREKLRSALPNCNINTRYN
jgi:Leucine-rich repeat (LRR) protein